MKESQFIIGALHNLCMVAKCALEKTDPNDRQECADLDCIIDGLSYLFDDYNGELAPNCRTKQD